MRFIFLIYFIKFFYVVNNFFFGKYTSKEVVVCFRRGGMNFFMKFGGFVGFGLFCCFMGINVGFFLCF